MAGVEQDLERIVLAGRAVSEVLTDILHVAKRAIPGEDSVSTTLVRGDDPFTAAYSGEMALHADEIQYERGYGRCMESARRGVVLRIDDMRTEARWPHYTAQALERGVRSSLSIPLPFHG